MKRTPHTPNAKPRRRTLRLRFETIRTLLPAELRDVAAAGGCWVSFTSAPMK